MTFPFADEPMHITFTINVPDREECRRIAREDRDWENGLDEREHEGLHGDDED